MRRACAPACRASGGNGPDVLLIGTGAWHFQHRDDSLSTYSASLRRLRSAVDDLMQRTAQARRSTAARQPPPPPPVAHPPVPTPLIPPDPATACRRCSCRRPGGVCTSSSVPPPRQSTSRAPPTWAPLRLQAVTSSSTRPMPRPWRLQRVAMTAVSAAAAAAAAARAVSAAAVQRLCQQAVAAAPAWMPAAIPTMESTSSIYFICCQVGLDVAVGSSGPEGSCWWPLLRISGYKRSSTTHAGSLIKCACLPHLNAGCSQWCMIDGTGHASPAMNALVVQVRAFEWQTGGLHAAVHSCAQRG